MDKDKDKSKTTAKNAPSTQAGTPDLPLHGPFTRSEIDALLISQLGPVANSDEACKWLQNKGWILSGENYDCSSGNLNYLAGIFENKPAKSL